MNSVCIYGGGNIAHSLAAVISVKQPVTVVTRHPDIWVDRLSFVQGGLMHNGGYDVTATSDASVVSGADIVFIALPQFAIDEAIATLLPNLRSGTEVVFVPAPARTAEYVKRIADNGCSVVGFQRVPFISRICEYGKSVSISYPRQVNKLVVSKREMRGEWVVLVQEWFGSKAEYLSSFLSFTFSNSNPLLHPARLVELLKGGDCGKYDRCPLFYAEWTDASSELYIKADEEMFNVFRAYAPECAMSDYESAFDHYEVSSSQALTQKIRTISSLKNILAPWVHIGDKWEPDYKSRYFTEDIPFGTKMIQDYARKVGVKTPVIDDMITCCCQYLDRV